MDQEKLSNLIDRLEVYAERYPAWYRLRVALLAALGYAYLLLLVLALLGVVVVSVASVKFNAVLFKFLWIPLVLSGLVLRSLWVTIPEPDGKELQREQAPRLFELVEEVRSRLRGPHVHHILLSGEFNAGIVQIPQLGMFGWTRNYLVAGLPLLQALSPEEFRSVLAHEFGHLSGKHGHFSGWIYRVRETWIQILTRVHQERHYASFLFEWFLKWYSPFFNAYSFVLARAQEREADEYSVELTGKAVAARSLVRITAKERALQEDFWPNFYRQAHDQIEPPRDPFAQMLQGLNRSVDVAKAEKWYLQALRVRTGYDDTHPALVDRLAAMGFDRQGLEEIQVVEGLVKIDHANSQNAAQFYLQELPEDFVAGLNRLFREEIAQTWRATHDYIQQARQRLDELEKKQQSQPLTLEEQWERARALGETKETAAALPALRKILDEHPDHIVANFALGAILLEQHDAAGIEYLEKAMQLDPSTTGDACEAIYDFHRGQGRQREADAYRQRAEQYYEKLQMLHQQAMNLSIHDHFEPHDLSEPQLQQLQSQLAHVRGLNMACLVRKVVEGAPEPLYIFGVMADYTWRSGRSEKNSAKLVNEMASELEFSRPVVFIALDGQYQYLQTTLKAIPGAVIFLT